MAQVNAVGVYDWKPIYQELATKLLAFEQDRGPLLDHLRKQAESVEGFKSLKGDRFADGSTGFIRDICPLTTFAMFNRSSRPDKRIEMIRVLQDLVGGVEALPTAFSGIPLVHAQASWFYLYDKNRDPSQIDSLWRLWRAGLVLADDDNDASRASFVAAFDDTHGRPCCAWGLTFALFWARPDYFVPLDGRSRATLRAAGFELGDDGPNGRVSGENYLSVCDEVRDAISGDAPLWPSIAEMSHGAFVIDARDGGEDSESEEAEDVTSSAGGRVWLVAAGNDGKKWSDWKARGIVAVSFEDVDLRQFETRADLQKRLVEIRGDESNPRNDSKACWEFLHAMQPGDEVFAKDGLTSVVGYGRVTGGYRFVARDGYCHEREVEWIATDRVVLPATSKQLPRKTLTDVTDDATAIATLRALFGLSNNGGSASATTAPARTFLFTWNPERWEWPELEASAAALARGEQLPADKWNTGSRHDLREGDRFFLLRQGSAPRGIIGSGRVLGPPVEQIHWEEERAAAGDTTRSAPIAYETLVSRDRLLTVEALKAAGLEGVRWNPQSSGTQIPPEFVAQVEAAWQAHLEGRTVASAGAVRAVEPYGLDELEGEGCFVPRARVESIVGRLRSKKNLILQGPPGTGKTWLAKRLGDLLVGHRNSGRVRVVQFHPNVSYEDFVRGYRPGSDGRLRIVDGLFMEAVKAAKARPDLPMVVVIEEINRGNPAQVFGELLTLLEASKRHPESAIELTYANPDEGGGDSRGAVHLPPNLYVIGTMNTADRSIAMVDIAFRRRFTFENLRPALDEAWLAFVERHGLPRPFANRVRNAVESLNDAIAQTKTLGPDYCLGHSFFTPHERLAEGAAPDWFDGVVEAEVAPLLYEYWFDDHPGAARALAQLRDAVR